VEGPFAGNPWFLAMLASTTGRVVIPSRARTGTALGAALLFAAPPAPQSQEETIAPDPRLKAYAVAWQAIVRRMS
jgi:sugar (pentulose or hexulose) kinase